MTGKSSLAIAGACAAASVLSMSFASAQTVYVVRNDGVFVERPQTRGHRVTIDEAEPRNVRLPRVAPVPTPRPERAGDARAGDATAGSEEARVNAEAKTFRIRHEPVPISTEPQPIPEERLSVRVVGPRFLPDETDMLKRVGSSDGVVASAESALAWAVSAVSSSLFGAAVAADEPRQAKKAGDVVASAE